MSQPRIPGEGKPEPVIIERGRWTRQRPGETPSEAMKRLEAGDGDPLPPELENMVRPIPRFSKGGRIR